jgi:citrate lyase beta subunit
MMLPTRREPVHVVYGGAHLFKFDTAQKLGRIALNSLETYASTPNELADALGINGDDSLAAEVFEQTRGKLEKEPVEDFRIDFEDGYGHRPGDEEDLHAKAAAVELARSIAERTSTAFTGIRVRALSQETRERALRTLKIFLSQLVESTDGELPERFAVTLPKVLSFEEVATLDTNLTTFEVENGFAAGTIEIELMIESPIAVFDREGWVALPRLVDAANGRCSSAHFGAYDYTSVLGISAKHQSLRHPACEFAKNIMLATLAPLGVRLVDSVTTEIPAPLHRGTDLSGEQQRENRENIHHAWKTHFDNVIYSMSNGFYQSWDLHPNQLIARFAAVTFFYLDAFKEHAERLRNYIARSQQATLTGAAFDDAASARGVVNFFLRGLNCGAFTQERVVSATGLNTLQLTELFPKKPLN